MNTEAEIHEAEYAQIDWVENRDWVATDDCEEYKEVVTYAID